MIGTEKITVELTRDQAREAASGLKLGASHLRAVADQVLSTGRGSQVGIRGYVAARRSEADDLDTLAATFDHAAWRQPVSIQEATAKEAQATHDNEQGDAA